MDTGNKTATFNETLGSLRTLLPTGWRLEAAPPAARFTHDADLQIWTPAGERALVAVEVKNRVDPIDVAGLVPVFSDYPKPNLLVAPFLSARTCRRLMEEGFNYADATGNVRIELRSPAVFISHTGLDENPSPPPEQRRSLGGMKAARIMRNLCDFQPPFRLRWLGMQSKTDPGYTSRVVELLEREEIVHRSQRGGLIESADWKAIIEQLARDYSLLKSNRHGFFVEPRGVTVFERNLGASGLNHLLTGSAAAEKVHPFSPVKQVSVYIDNIRDAAAKLGLHPVETGANVVLLEPRDPVLLSSPKWENGPLQSTGLSQICADLLTSPGRSPSEAEALMSWMERHLSSWRRNAEE